MIIEKGRISHSPCSHVGVHCHRVLWSQNISGAKKAFGTLMKVVFDCGQQFLTVMSKPSGSPFVHMFIFQVRKMSKRRQRWF